MPGYFPPWLEQGDQQRLENERQWYTKSLLFGDRLELDHLPVNSPNNLIEKSAKETE